MLSLSSITTSQVVLRITFTGLFLPNFVLFLSFFIFRIGRTGRKGNSGTAYTFFTQKDGKNASDLIGILKEANQVVNPQLYEMEIIGRQFKQSNRRWGGGGGGGKSRGGGGGGKRW